MALPFGRPEGSVGSRPPRWQEWPAAQIRKVTTLPS